MADNRPAPRPASPRSAGKYAAVPPPTSYTRPSHLQSSVSRSEMVPSHQQPQAPYTKQSLPPRQDQQRERKLHHPQRPPQIPPSRQSQPSLQKQPTQPNQQRHVQQPSMAPRHPSQNFRPVPLYCPVPPYPSYEDYVMYYNYYESAIFNPYRAPGYRFGYFNSPDTISQSQMLLTAECPWYDDMGIEEEVYDYSTLVDTSCSVNEMHRNPSYLNSKGPSTSPPQKQRPDVMHTRQASGHTSANIQLTRKPRKNLFDEYIARSDVESGLQSKKYLKGILHINKKQRSNSYVTCDEMTDDVLIYGDYRRNRAGDGDTVVLELINQEAVHAEKTRMDKERRLTHERRTVQPELVNSETDDPEMKDEPSLSREKKALCGKIVYILERHAHPLYVGTISAEMPFNKQSKQKAASSATVTNRDDKKQPNDTNESSMEAAKPKKKITYVWFQPTDTRVPFINIGANDCPKELIADLDKFSSDLFVASMIYWPVTARFPFGRIHRRLGPIGNIFIESDAILKANDVNDQPFSDKVLACLPQTPWTIPRQEYITRKDCRDLRIFTIDPKTAKDLDDAVHVRRLDDGNLEVGVHIADVSYFVTDDTELNHLAATRCTTVYLVQKAIPMLPHLLCEQLCSLNPNTERLAFSVFWKMTEEAGVLDTYFSRTVIKSCAKLAYEDAQDIIEGRDFEDHVSIVNHDREGVKEDIRLFHKLSTIMRQRRFENGALAMNTLKVNFSLDQSSGLPTTCDIYVQRDSNKLIEEFMLLANMSVAQRIEQAFPNRSLLRYHPPPLKDRLGEFVEFAHTLGYEIDASSAGALHKSFEAVDDPRMQQMLKQLCIKPMQRALYFCTGTKEREHFRHFALNVPLYTHFTSPIRRYADIMVHRLLDCALRQQPFPHDSFSVQRIASKCNAKKNSARAAQDESSKLYLCVFLHTLQQQQNDRILSEATVLEIKPKCFDIIIEEYAIEYRIFYEDMGISHFEMDKKKLTVNVWWSSAASSTPTESNSDTNFPNVEKDIAHNFEQLTISPSGVNQKNNDKSKNTKLKNDSLLQKITTLKIIPVAITVDMTRSPPRICVVAINPFSEPLLSDQMHHQHDLHAKRTQIEMSVLPEAYENDVIET